MTPTRDPATIAQNVLRYLDVLASEWRTMREFLVAQDPAFGSEPFGSGRRRADLALPEIPVPAGELGGVPSVLRPDTLGRNRDDLAAILPRLRFSATPLDDVPLTECVSLLISPFVPRSRGGTLALVAPEDEEAGRMMARALWLRELPPDWSVTTEVFESFRGLTERALDILAGNPVGHALLRSVLASVILVDHPTQRAGVCSASVTHVWVSPRHCPDAGVLADILLAAAVQNGLYVDELVHAKWATDPLTLDTTTVEAPLIGVVQPMEYDTAFHAVHVEYMRSRRDGADPSSGAAKAIRTGIAGLLAHPGHLSTHGRVMLDELYGLCAGAPVS